MANGNGMHTMPDGSVMPDAAMPPQGAAPTGPAAPPAGPAPTLGQPTATTPEEQAMYSRIVARSFELIYGDDSMPKIVDMLDGGGNPPQGLAKTAAMVIGRVGAAAEKAGEQLDPVVAFHALKEIVEDLAHLSGVAGIHDYQQDQDGFEAAWLHAVDEWRLMLQGAGEIDQAAAQEDMSRLEAMDQSGELETLFNGLDKGGGEKGGQQPSPAAEEAPKGRGLMAAAGAR
jgi:hypothetical protein